MLVVNNIYFAVIGFGCNTWMLDVVTFLSLFLSQLLKAPPLKIRSLNEGLLKLDLSLVMLLDS